jgi:predicted alpha/beta-hydrolase family hydrolase
LKSSEELKIELEAGASTTALVYEPDGPSAGASLILAHGAGAGQRSPFMVAFASALASRGITTITFNFLYTERNRRVPDRRPALDACYVAAIAAAREQVAAARDALFIGGKSMGGRIATHVAAADPSLPVTGLVLLGYPLHPPGRPDQRRDAHLSAVGRPMLIVQGERDTFGTPSEFDAVLDAVSPRPTLHVVAGGDHSFKVARAGRSAQDAVHEDVQRTIVEWIGEVRRSARETRQRHD